MALRMLERFRFSQLCKAEYIHGFRKHCRIIHCSGLFSHEPNYVRSTDTTQKSQDCQETIRSAKLEEDAPREFCICTSRDVSQWMLWMTGKAVTHPRLPSFCGKGSSLGNTAPTNPSHLISLCVLRVLFSLPPFVSQNCVALSSSECELWRPEWASDHCFVRKRGGEFLQVETRKLYAS